jgi:hypothetical protein
MAVIACPKHGPDCDYNLTLHPLPSQGRDATSKGPYADWDEGLDAPTPEPARAQMERP